MTIEETLRQIDEEQTQQTQSPPTKNTDKPDEVDKSTILKLSEQHRIGVHEKPKDNTKDSKGTKDKKDDINPIDHSRYTLDRMSNSSTGVTKMLDKFNDKIGDMARTYGMIGQGLNNKTMIAYEDMLGIDSPYLKQLRQLDSNVSSKFSQLESISSLGNAGKDVARRAGSSFSDQRDRRLQGINSLRSRSAGNINSGLRLGKNLSNVGMSLGMADTTSKLVFGDKGKGGIPALMDILEKSTRPVSVGGVRSSLGGDVLNNIDNPVLKSIAQPLTSVVNVVSTSLGGLHGAIEPVAKGLTVYAHGMSKLNTFLFGSNFVKNTIASTFKKGDIGRLSGGAITSNITKPIVDLKTMAVGKLLEHGGGAGGILAMYGSAFTDMGISIITRKVGSIISKIVTKSVKFIRDSGKRGLTQKIKPKELKFRESTVDQILRRYSGDPDLADTTINQIVHAKGATITPQESAMYMALNSIRINTSPIAGILAHLENEKQLVEINGHKSAQNKIAEMSATGSGNMAVGANMVGPLEKFLNWTGDKLNMARLLLPSANISNTLRGLSSTKMLKDIEYNRQQENISIEKSREFGVNLDDYSLIHKTPASLIRKGKSYQEKVLILLAGQMQLQQYISKELLTIRQASGIKEQVTLTDDINNNRGILNALDNLLGYIPGYALASVATKQIHKIGTSLLPSNIESTKNNAKDFALKIGSQVATDTGIYFSNERDLLGQLRDMSRDNAGKLDKDKAGKYNTKSLPDLFNQFYVYEYPKLIQEQTSVLSKSLTVQLQMLMALEKLSGTNYDKSYLNQVDDFKMINHRTGKFETSSTIKAENDLILDDIKKLIRSKDGATSLLDFAFKMPKDLLLKGIDTISGGKMMNSIEAELLNSDSVKSILQTDRTTSTTAPDYLALANSSTTTGTSFSHPQTIQNIEHDQLSLQLSNIRISDLSASRFFDEFRTLIPQRRTDPTSPTHQTINKPSNEIGFDKAYGFVDDMKFQLSNFHKRMSSSFLIGDMYQALHGRSASKLRREAKHQSEMQKRYKTVSKQQGISYNHLRRLTDNVDTILKSNDSVDSKQLILLSSQVQLLQIIGTSVLAIQKHFGAKNIISTVTKHSDTTLKTAVTDALGYIPMMTSLMDIANLGKWGVNKAIALKDDRKKTHKSPVQNFKILNEYQRLPNEVQTPPHITQQLIPKIENKTKWTETQKIVDLTPEVFFKAMHIATQQKTSMIDDFSKIKGLLGGIKSQKCNCTVKCCNDDDSPDRRRRRRKRRTRRNHRTRRPSRLGRIGKIGKLAGGVATSVAGGAVASKTIGKSIVKSGSKYIGKKVLGKIAGAGLASLLGPIGLLAYGAYNLYDTYSTAKDLYGQYKELHHKVPAKDIPNAQEIVSPKNDIINKNNKSEFDTKEFFDKLEKLIGTLNTVSTVNATRIITELESLKKVIALTPTQTPIVGNIDSSNTPLLETPFNLSTYFMVQSDGLVNGIDSNISSFLTKH